MQQISGSVEPKISEAVITNGKRNGEKKVNSKQLLLAVFVDSRKIASPFYSNPKD